MSERYDNYPTTVKELAAVLKQVCDDYKARLISNTELRDQILWYAQNVPDKLFNGADFNSTLKVILGQRRIDIISTVLDGFQPTFGDV